MADSTSICVFPISGTYLPFHRYLYYLSLIISVLYPTPPPLVKGAFAYSLTYSSTAALYAFLIAVIPSSPHIVNLDIFGLWAVLSTACIVVLPMIQWTKNLKGSGSSSARPIIRIWGVLVFVGVVCTFVEMVRWGKLDDQSWDMDLCRSAPSGAKESKLRLRSPESIRIAEYEPVFGYFYDIIIHRISPLVFLPAAFGLISCLVTIAHNPPIYADDQTSWVGDSPVVPARSFTLFSALRNGFAHLRMLVVCLTPLLFIPTIVINELHLLNYGGEGIPEAERLYEIGQWGLLVGAGWIAAAAWVSNIAGKERKVVDEFGGVTGEIVND